MKWTCIFALFLILTTGAQAVSTSAKSAILYEAETGRILYQKNAEEQREIASTTKIMTALIVCENADLDEIVTVKPEFSGIEGTSIYLKAGEKISVKTLLYGMMLKSGNDAALALADCVGGSVERFVSMMNMRASELGMQSTHFENPNGLPAEGHVSTALDMAKLASHAMKNDIFRTVVSSKTYSAEGRAFTNHNKLLKMRDDIDGVKTGYTKAAGRCLVSSCVRDDMRLVAVTLYDPNDWDDHLNLYDYGFANFSKNTVISEGESVCEIPLANGGKLPLVSEMKLSYVGGKDEISQLKTEIYAPKLLYAPIEKGQVIGEIRITKDGKVMALCDLLSGEDVQLPEEKSFFKKYFGWFISWFK